jgi:hypothetical protein
MKTKLPQNPENTPEGGLLESPCCLPSVAEMEALEKAINHGEYEIRRAQEQLAAMQRKQIARQHELGYQKARMGLKPGSRVSDEAKPGYRMVIAQTDSGIATRWIPDNA